MKAGKQSRITFPAYFVPMHIIGVLAFLTGAATLFTKFRPMLVGRVFMLLVKHLRDAIVSIHDAAAAIEEAPELLAQSQLEVIWQQRKQLLPVLAQPGAY